MGPQGIEKPVKVRSRPIGRDFELAHDPRQHATHGMGFPDQFQHTYPDPGYVHDLGAALIHDHTFVDNATEADILVQGQVVGVIHCCLACEAGIREQSGAGESSPNARFFSSSESIFSLYFSSLDNIVGSTVPRGEDAFANPARPGSARLSGNGARYGDRSTPRGYYLQVPRVLQQPAYVLHARAYRETSLLLETLTRDHGRTAMVARGAKRPKSKWRNLLQPFRPLLISWSARTELGTLTSADQVAAPPALHGEALFCGMYLNELLLRLLHRGDPHAEVFERYRAVLADLASGLAPQPLLRIFEKHLLDAVGYGLTLDREPGSQVPVRADAYYDYHPDRGPVRVAGARKGAISGTALLALQSEQLEDVLLPELRRLMRRVIGYHLGDRPLASAALFGQAADRMQASKEAGET
jgi:DNA repair protein RecO (recombination protein O)